MRLRLASRCGAFGCLLPLLIGDLLDGAEGAHGGARRSDAGAGGRGMVLQRDAKHPDGGKVALDTKELHTRRAHAEGTLIIKLTVT